MPQIGTWQGQEGSLASLPPATGEAVRYTQSPQLRHACCGEACETSLPCLLS